MLTIVSDIPSCHCCHIASAFISKQDFQQYETEYSTNSQTNLQLVLSFVSPPKKLFLSHLKIPKDYLHLKVSINVSYLKPWLHQQDFFLISDSNWLKPLDTFGTETKLTVRRFTNNLQGLQKVMVKDMKCFTF